MTERAEKARKWAEVSANVMVILVGIVFLIVVARNYIRDASRAELHRPISVGMKLGLKDVNWQSGGRQHVVLALSTGCHFCSESAPFYRELVKKCKEEHVPTLAVFPQPQSEAAEYLKEKGVTVDDIRQSPLQLLQVPATPTLLLVNDQGIVSGVWVGRIPQQREKEVLAKLGS